MYFLSVKYPKGSSALEPRGHCFPFSKAVSEKQAFFPVCKCLVIKYGIQFGQKSGLKLIKIDCF